jgi:hypothetical protein
MTASSFAEACILDRLLDAEGGTGKSYGRKFQGGVSLLPGDDALPREDASAQTLGILPWRQIVPWQDRSAPCGLLSPASVRRSRDAASAPPPPRPSAAPAPAAGSPPVKGYNFNDHDEMCKVKVEAKT